MLHQRKNPKITGAKKSSSQKAATFQKGEKAGKRRLCPKAKNK